MQGIDTQTTFPNVTPNLQRLHELISHDKPKACQVTFLTKEFDPPIAEPYAIFQKELGQGILYEFQEEIAWRSKLVVL